MYDDEDREMIHNIREERKRKKQDFNKLINKKDLNRYEMDELFT